MIGANDGRLLLLLRLPRSQFQQTLRCGALLDKSFARYFHHSSTHRAPIGHALPRINISAEKEGAAAKTECFARFGWVKNHPPRVYNDAAGS